MGLGSHQAVNKTNLAFHVLPRDGRGRALIVANESSCSQWSFAALDEPHNKGLVPVTVWFSQCVCVCVYAHSKF